LDRDNNNGYLVWEDRFRTEEQLEHHIDLEEDLGSIRYIEVPEEEYRSRMVVVVNGVDLVLVVGSHSRLAVVVAVDIRNRSAVVVDDYCDTAVQESKTWRRSLSGGAEVRMGVRVDVREHTMLYADRVGEDVVSPICMFEKV
jgi:hypothetical protein